MCYNDNMTERMYSIGEVADELNRVPHTLRIWEYNKRLPKQLLPSRDERGWRWWTRAQIDGLKEWVIETDMRPGKSLRTTKDKYNKN